MLIKTVQMNILLNGKLLYICNKKAVNTIPCLTLKIRKKGLMENCCNYIWNKKDSYYSFPPLMFEMYVVLTLLPAHALIHHRLHSMCCSPKSQSNQWKNISESHTNHIKPNKSKCYTKNQVFKLVHMDSDQYHLGEQIKLKT